MKNEEMFAKRYRQVLLVWVLIVNCIVHLLEIPDGWLIFISNILFFTIEGKDSRKKLLTIEFGGVTGLVLGYAMIMGMGVLMPRIGNLPGFLIPLAPVLACIILLHPRFPMVFNNAAFAYLTIACIRPEALAANIVRYLITFIVGSLAFNLPCILLGKLVGKWTEKQNTL